jgi:hypothetical protein
LGDQLATTYRGGLSEPVTPNCPSFPRQPPDARSGALGITRAQTRQHIPVVLTKTAKARTVVSTTMIYTHVLNKGPRTFRSPLDA